MCLAPATQPPAQRFIKIHPLPYHLCKFTREDYVTEHVGNTKMNVSPTSDANITSSQLPKVLEENSI